MKKTLDITLVRHGMTEGNKYHILSGYDDVKLVPEGIEALKEYKKTYNYPETERYFCSDLIRTIDTAEILYPDKKFIKNPLFREINFGIYEGVKESEFEISFEEFFDRCMGDIEIKDGENYRQFCERIHPAFDELNQKMIEEETESYTLVTHSGVIRCLYVYCTKSDKWKFRTTNVYNGLGFNMKLEFDSEKEKWKCIDIKRLNKKNF